MNQCTDCTFSSCSVGCHRAQEDADKQFKLRVAAERQIDALRVCGNCAIRYDSPPRISWDGHECGVFRLGDEDVWRDEENWPMVKCSDACHFTPSRWAASAAASYPEMDGAE